MRGIKSFVILLILVILVSQLFGFLMTRITIWNLPKGKIVFSSYKDGDAEVYIMNIDGSGLKQLTENYPTKNNIASDTEPSFSPNGEEIVFTSSRRSKAKCEDIVNYRGNIIGEKCSGGSFDICRMDVSGNNQTPLTPPGELNRDPYFSQNGENIVFRTNAKPERQTRVMKKDGRDLIIYHRGTGQCKFYNNMVFDTFNRDLSVLVLDASERFRLTDFLLGNNAYRNSYIYEFCLSNNGKRLAFILKESRKEENEFYDNLKFFIINTDGSDLKLIYEVDDSKLPDIFTDKRGFGSFGFIDQLKFSFDDKQIILLIDFHYKQGIYSIDLKDNSVKELTDKNYMWRDILDFTFTPDGKKILFVADAFPFDNPYLLGYTILFDNIVSQIKYLVFKKESTFYDNKYLCVMDIDGRNFHKIAKLPRGTELGRDFIHWEVK